MALFEFSDRSLSSVPVTTLAAEHVLERADLQRALRERIDVLGDDLLVVSEEFGDFDVNRRIDLLCVDRTGQLVVVELKRTTDGGHLELQALRYAAMVSVMTFDQLVTTFDRYLGVVDPPRAGQARELLADFLEDADGEETVLQRRVRIVLVSGGFDTQITTTVLWLNDLYGLDITCVRLVAYKLDDRLLLDVQQVIPLPEAAELTVRLRHREEAARAANSTDGRDLTRYVVAVPAGATEPLPKRRALLTVVHALVANGVAAEDVASTIRRAKFLPVDGTLSGSELDDAFTAAYPRSEHNLRRWFMDDPVHSGGRTWVLSKMWGVGTYPLMNELIALSESSDILVTPAP
ncbi:hypothetical protein [Modestobacter altitudinis]|uniref:hypothetical protein n=1 Tax=Modestobacter altitudinis TaxID=2213158 RepID=UPI00110D1FB5|nr:hypothetical protein [Modestobacter altitudinis]